jgi:glucosamine--fructose-6-phosphate aminotransferase (isomerizing)
MGYVGEKKDAIGLVINGLKQLEYRGYDSAGVAAIVKGGLGRSVFLRKSVGRVGKLEEKVNGSRSRDSNCAIAHTRWATHGAPSVKNSHPHHGCGQKIFLVHNGIIENYLQLKSSLQKDGHVIASDTDTEIVAHLIERYYGNGKNIKLESAVMSALKQVEGSFALGIISASEPGKIVAARRSSPLVVGLGENGHFLASDVSALTEHTKKVVYMRDEEIAVLTDNNFSLLGMDGRNKNKTVDTVDWDVEQARKEGFPHFMIKEIYGQPQTISDSFRGRITINGGGVRIKLAGLEVLEDRLKEIKRIIIASCGTSYYAGLVGKYLFESFARLPTEVDLASEFRYRDAILEKDTAFLSISQSGETADTLAALRLAKKNGNLSLGLVNTVGSTIARETDAGVYNHIGPEIGVASTKAFTSQMIVLILMALFLGSKNGMRPEKKSRMIRGLARLPGQIAEILKKEEDIKKLVLKYGKCSNFLYLGRRYNYPVALEGALKLKEISYVHAEGYAAGEMKHGPIALIDESFPTMAILGPVKSETYEKTFSNLKEIEARKGPIIAVAQEGDEQIKKIANDIIYIPETLEELNPILAVVPLQLFAYHMAVLKGYDPDKPRNLAKSVTVE